MKECKNGVCGVRRVDGHRTGSEYGVKKLMWRSSETEELLRNASREEMRIHMTGTGHRELLFMKQAIINVAKRMAYWRWGEPLRNDFDESKKMFWKEVN